MDMAALSIGMNQAQFQQSVNIALTKKVMDISETQNNGLLKLISSSSPSPHPTTGNAIDIRV